MSARACVYMYFDAGIRVRTCVYACVWVYVCVVFVGVRALVFVFLCVCVYFGAGMCVCVRLCAAKHGCECVYL